MTGSTGAAVVVRTVLRMRALPGREADFQRAWAEAAEGISRAPGNIRQELSQDIADPRTFLIISDWADRAAVDAFGRSSAREQLTAALRELREDAGRSTYEVVGSIAATKGLPVRIDLTTTVGPGEEDAFERAYEIVTERLVGTPGLVREELLREPGSNVYHIFAEWETERDFVNWVEDPSHADQSGPLVRWLSVDFARKLYEIRFRPKQNVATPGTSDFGSIGRHRSSTAVLARKTPVALPSAPLAVAAMTVAPAPAERVVNAPSTAVPGTRSIAVTSRPAACEVLVVGAGPVGLTAAIELARRGIAVRVIETTLHPSPQADKAIGIHCRTMEIWERQGVVGEALDTGILLHGQTVFVNGRQTHQVDWAGLPEIPYAHLGLPQYETERILTQRLTCLGVAVERGVELVSFAQDPLGVTADVRLVPADGGQPDADSSPATIRSQFLIGCDGAHSRVRSGLGLEFQGGLSMFPQLFMLGDVDLDWDMPAGHLLRFVRIEQDGDFTGMLVCVPLKGCGRYRIATLAPPDLQKTIGAGVVEAGFWREYPPPSLADIQAVLDDLAPAGTTASNLRWSSIFRIKHGIVDRYRDGRIFVAGDAAHLHPPAGGQGMNTGIQDAWNLGWKLALAVRGFAAPGLLDSYDAERRPAGRAVVDRAVAIAFTDEMDMADEKEQFLLEMQMTMNYRDSPLVGSATDDELRAGCPGPGYRAPDAAGLTRPGVSHPIRLFDLLGGIDSTLVLYADTSVNQAELLDLEKLTAMAQQQSAGQVRSYLVTGPGTVVPAALGLPVLQDSAGSFREAYGTTGLSGYLVRPDGHIGFRGAPVLAEALFEHLRLTYLEA